MANKRDIKRRIASVSNTHKITSAMKLVAASKFSRSAVAVNASRPYTKAFAKMVRQLLSSADADVKSDFLSAKPEKKILIAVLSTDKGLCGGINTNLCKLARAWIDDKNKENIAVDVVSWGRKAIQFFKKQQETVVETREFVLVKPNYVLARELAEFLKNKFLVDNYDGVYVAFTKFQSAISQVPHIAKLFPIDLKDDEKEIAADNKSENKSGGSFIVEPSLNELINNLITRKITGEVLQILLEAAASEHGSRMTAMDNATNNAVEVKKSLTLKYNRARQAAITTELTEIVAGAEAL